jgi:glycosyltransferase involved in cell wall biosynthesis
MFCLPKHPMKLLFLDQSGKLGGAELCLLDIANNYRDRCLVGLLADGPFRTLLEQQQIPVQVLTTQAIQVQKYSNLRQGIVSFGQLLPTISRVAQLSRHYDLIYANTQKALVVGAIASWLSGRPLVYHLHDIISTDHFSPVNQRLIVMLVNRFASRVIANSYASQTALVAAGGRVEITEVVYNGFAIDQFQSQLSQTMQTRQALGLTGQFVIGHFSRLSPWKGQHVLIEALAHCPEPVCAVLVGEALFGEDAYVASLHQQVERLGLRDRVQFLGFRSDVTPLMAACDLIAHTSTAPEPFGRVIVEGMLCSKPVIAAAAGGAIELIDHGKTGWLVPPGDPLKLAEMIRHCYHNPEIALQIAGQGQAIASQRFHLDQTNQQINALLQQVLIFRSATSPRSRRSKD